MKSRAIVTRWRARLRIRKALLLAARKRHEANPTAVTRAALERRKRQVEYAERVIRRHTGRTPKIVNLRLSIQNKFGTLGAIKWVTGHHTAGPKDKSDSHAEALFTSFNVAHAAKGWGGIGYHFGLARSGTLYLLRPVGLKGAHVGAHNTGNIGIVCNGTTGDHPTVEQAETLQWLLENAHTSAMPVSHRTPTSLKNAQVRGHNDWMGHESNSCPGTHKTMYLSRGERW